MLYKITKPEHGSALWLKVRWKTSDNKARISASVAGAVHGEHPFTTIADLATELLSADPPAPKETNAAMLRGTTLEPVVANMAEQLLGLELEEPQSMYCYDDDGVRLIATIDRMDKDGNVYEIKTTNRHWKGELQDYWKWQGIQQAICTGVDEINWLIFDASLDIHHYVQKVSSDDKGYHISKCREFLAAIDMGMMPNDAVVEYKHVTARFPEGNPDPNNAVDLGPSVLAMIERYLLAKEQKAQAETVEDLIKAQICEMLGEAEYGLMQDELLVTWKTASRTSFDTKAFQKAHPALYEKYKKETKYRTFRVVGKDK